jgi:hypothetical protein
MAPKLQTVHVRVNDAASGQPTPVRVRFTDADGTYHAPLGRLADFATGRNQDVGGHVRLGMKPWAYVEGSFEINLPPGTIRAEIHKGPEYRPLVQEIEFKPGKLALRFTIERTVNLPAERWYSGDARAHALSPHGALLEAQAEDIHVINLLAALTEVSDPGGKKTALSNILAFSGQRPALETSGYLVVVNTHNTHPVLGSLGLLNCHRVVYPLTFGGPDAMDDWTFADWCDQCRRKGGLVVWTRTWHENADAFVGEPLVDLLLGRVDAFELDHFEDSPFDVVPLWYDLLDAGLKVPLVGSSGKESNAGALGVMRTYARLQPGEDFGYRTWIEAVRAGRTFVTNGPLLLVTVNDQDPGSSLTLDKPGTPLRVRAEVKSQVPFDALEVLVNGAVAAATDKTKLDAEIAVAQAGWLAVRCRGSHPIFDRPSNQCVFAHTSPFYLRTQDRPTEGKRESIRKLLIQIDLMEAWVKDKARCRTDHERGRFLALTAAARAALLSRI